VLWVYPMRLFAALAVAALGIGAYAAAVLVHERRDTYSRWVRKRRAAQLTAGAREGADGARGAGRNFAASATRMIAPAPVALTVAGLVVAGTLLIFGACIGLIRF
jgi:hypothetical protein